MRFTHALSLVSLCLVGCAVDFCRTEIPEYGFRFAEHEWGDHDTPSRMLRVTAVACAGSAAREGMRPGDWILSIDGNSTNPKFKESYRRGLRTYAQARQLIPVVISRGASPEKGKPKVLRLRPAPVSWVDICEFQPDE